MLLVSLCTGLSWRDLIVLLVSVFSLIHKNDSEWLERKVAVTWTSGCIRAPQSLWGLLNIDEHPLCSGCWYLSVSEGPRDNQGRWGSCWLSGKLLVPSCCNSAPTSLMPGKLLACTLCPRPICWWTVRSAPIAVYEEESRVMGWNVESDTSGQFVSLCGPSSEGWWTGMNYMKS